MRTVNLFLSAAFLLLSTLARGQESISRLLEIPLNHSEKETVQFLKSMTNGKEQVAVQDGMYRSYSLEGPSFHLEFKIAGDTCIAAMLRIIQNSGFYNSTVRQILASTKPFGQNRLKQTTNGLLIYELHSAESLITAMSYRHALKTLRKKGY